MPVYFVGFTTSPISDWRSHIDKPVPPANYKKQETIDEWMEQAVKKQEERAAKIAPLSRVRDVCVWSLGATEPDLPLDDPKLLLPWLVSIKNSFEPARLVGFDVERFVRTLYCEAGRSGGMYEHSFLPLAEVLENTLDPYRHLVPEWERNDVSCLTLCRLVGAALTEANSADPKALALAARVVAARARLL